MLKPEDVGISAKLGIGISAPPEERKIDERGLQPLCGMHCPDVHSLVPQLLLLRGRANLELGIILLAPLIRHPSGELRRTGTEQRSARLDGCEYLTQPVALHLAMPTRCDVVPTRAPLHEPFESGHHALLLEHAAALIELFQPTRPIAPTIAHNEGQILHGPTKPRRKR